MNKYSLSLLCVGMVIFSILVNYAVAEETSPNDSDGITLTAGPLEISVPILVPITWEPVIFEWEPTSYYFSSSSCSMESISFAPIVIIDAPFIPVDIPGYNTPIPNSGMILLAGLIGMIGVIRKKIVRE